MFYTKVLILCIALQKPNWWGFEPWLRALSRTYFLSLLSASPFLTFSTSVTISAQFKGLSWSSMSRLSLFPPGHDCPVHAYICSRPQYGHSPFSIELEPLNPVKSSILRQVHHNKSNDCLPQWLSIAYGMLHGLSRICRKGFSMFVWQDLCLEQFTWGGCYIIGLDKVCKEETDDSSLQWHCNKSQILREFISLKW